jgi:transcription initiation factor TFIIE subunit alpha
MRLTKEVAEELVKEVAGEDTVKLVDLLKDQENISEFKLAEKLRLTVNNVRNMLYRLQAHNLVTSTRKKDKKKGWYIYYWTFNISQAKSLIRVVKTRKLEHLKDRLRSEIQESFYICPQKCVRFKMENAMDYDFKCPECGNLLQEENNMDFILKIKNTIMELEGELSKPTLETRTQPKTEELVKRGRPKLSKRGRPRLVQRGRPKLVARGRPRLVARGRPKLVARGRPKLSIVKKPKLKLKKISKPKIRKIRLPKRITRMPKHKKKGILKRVGRFLRRK